MKTNQVTGAELCYEAGFDETPKRRNRPKRIAYAFAAGTAIGSLLSTLPAGVAPSSSPRLADSAVFDSVPPTNTTTTVNHEATTITSTSTTTTTEVMPVPANTTTTSTTTTTSPPEVTTTTQAYGCAAAEEYIYAISPPPNTNVVCPGYAGGHQATTNIVCNPNPTGGPCIFEVQVIFADPCAAAYDNEGANIGIVENQYRLQFPDMEPGEKANMKGVPYDLSGSC